MTNRTIRTVHDGGMSRRGVLMGTAALAAVPLLGKAAWAQDNIDMRISWWGSQDRHQKTLEMIKAFEAKHPGLSLTPEYGGFLGYADKLSTEFASNSAPDIMQLPSSHAPVLIESNRLMPLDDLIASGKIDVSDGNQTVIETSKVDGKLYGLPWGLACGCFFIDTKVFGDAGIDLPENSWNWDKFAELAKSLSDATPDGLYGSADIWAPAGTRALEPFNFFLRGRGKHAFTTDGQLGFGEDELTEWLTFWDDLRKAGAVPPAAVTALESGFETAPIVTGRTAMYPINSSIASSLQGLAPNPLFVAPIPTGIDSKVLSGTEYGPFINAVMQVYINADTKDADVAADFLNFITNDPEAAKIQLMARGVLLSAAMTKDVMSEILPVEQAMVDMVRYVQDHAKAEIVAPPVEGGEIESLMQRTHQEVAFEASSVADAVSKFFSEADKILQ